MTIPEIPEDPTSQGRALQRALPNYDKPAKKSDRMLQRTDDSAGDWAASASDISDVGPLGWLVGAVVGSLGWIWSRRRK